LKPIELLFPPSGPATGSFNGLHAKSKLLAATNLIQWTRVGTPVVGDGNLLVRTVETTGPRTFWRWAVWW
jgi:hypothetical protein